MVEVRVTDVVVTGLTPGANYTLSVTAENAVSSQDTTGRNVISTTIRTEGGGILNSGRRRGEVLFHACMCIIIISKFIA